jgi:hypothetical protein
VFPSDMATTAVDQKTSAKKEGSKLRFPAWYDPNSPEVKERRRNLFENLKKNQTPETDLAMNELADRFLRKFQP